MAGSGSSEQVPAAGLKDRLAAEMKEALKAGQKIRLATLRLLAAAVKNREVEVRHHLSDEEFVDVAGREAKRRREAIEAYRQGGREDRAEVERQELDVLKTYLPAMLSDDEVDALVDEALASTGATGPGDMGKVMGFVMARARGRVEGKTVQEKVRSRLEG
jgi:uncharacterized protein YqeY